MRNHKHRRPADASSSPSSSIRKTQQALRHAAAGFCPPGKFERLEPRVLLNGHVADDHDHDHEQLVEVYVPPTVFQFNHTGFLSSAAKGKPADIALNFLRNNARSFGLEAGDLESPFVSSQYRDSISGITHIYLMQEFNGLGVTNARINVSVMPDGRILSAGGGFVPGLGELERTAPAPVPQIDPRQALRSIAGVLEVNQTEPIGISNRTNRLDKRQTVTAPDYSVDAFNASLQYVAMPDGTVQLGWKMVLDMPGRDNWYELTVDSTRGGVVLEATDYYNHAVKPGTTLDAPRGSSGSAGVSGVVTPTYNVIPMPVAHPHDPTPGTSPNRSLVTGVHDPVASPFGWHDTDGAPGHEFSTTQGNNVHAYIDRDGSSNVPDPGSSPSGGASMMFDFPIDLTQSPLTYQPAAVTNLFYWNNLIHDVTYRYGFTEPAGNFQVNNYGNGGLGNDYVQAEAQDGSGTNNANMATSPDGTRPRMQMYLWTGVTPNRDGDLDNRIIVHEYGHGISKRLTGGPNTTSVLTSTQPGGMGEGWSDFFSLLFTQKATDTPNQGVGVGTYSLNQPNDGKGVRRFPYSYDMLTQPLTFGAYGSGSITYPTHSGTVTVTKSTQVHASGEIWCATLWDMTWNLIDKHGFSSNFAAGYDPTTGNDKGNQLAMRLVMDALKIQVGQPTFIQARDAILAADVALTGGDNQLEIWRAFARRGLGVNASTASATATTINLDFSIPLADPYVNSHTPAGSLLSPVNNMQFSFNQAMDQKSFSVVDDVASFTGPGGVDLKSTITGFSWVNATTLRVDFPTTSVVGQYSMTIGPNILALDDGNPMDMNANGIPGEPGDEYTGAFAYQTFLGPEGFGYHAAEYPFEEMDLVIGQPGVTVLVNGSDDAAGTIALPAGTTFNYYGTNHTTIFANANGLIMFGTSTTAFTNGTMETSPSQAAIAPLWDDWRTDLTGAGATDSAVLWKLDGDRLIIEWSDVTNRVAADGTATFQAILQLNTSGTPGRILFNYPDITAGNATQTNGGSSSVGIKNSGTQSATNPAAHRLLVSLNSQTNSWVQNGKAILVATDVTAPQVSDAQFNFLTSQSISVTFNDNVGASIDAADLVLFNSTTNTTIDSAMQLASYDSGTNTATFTWPGLTGGILPDGNYTATLLAAGITDASGNPMDGDNNGTIGGDHTFSFFFINGDANRDGNVNLADFNILAANFGQSPRNFSQGDFNYDGIVNLADFNILAARFGTSLNPGTDATAGDGSSSTGEKETLPPPPAMPIVGSGSSIGTFGRVGSGGGRFGDTPIPPPSLPGDDQDLIDLI